MATHQRLQLKPRKKAGLDTQRRSRGTNLEVRWTAGDCAEFARRARYALPKGCNGGGEGRSLACLWQVHSAAREPGVHLRAALRSGHGGALRSIGRNGPVGMSHAAVVHRARRVRRCGAQILADRGRRHRPTCQDHGSHQSRRNANFRLLFHQESIWVEQGFGPAFQLEQTPGL